MDYKTILETLKAASIEITDAFSYDNYIEGVDEDIMYRLFLDRNTIQAGRKKYFDRWANSLEFDFTIPKDVLGLRATIEAIRVEACKEVPECDEWDWPEPLTASSHYRRIRKQLKKEMK